MDERVLAALRHFLLLEAKSSDVISGVTGRQGQELGLHGQDEDYEEQVSSRRPPNPERQWAMLGEAEHTRPSWGDSAGTLGSQGELGYYHPDLVNVGLPEWALLETAAIIRKLQTNMGIYQDKGAY
jgi:hypothetical protein